jgi:carbonic anhydrase
MNIESYMHPKRLKMSSLLFSLQVSAFERRALIMQQYPSVAILGCSDSRVPIEIVFDQGLGDMFVIRVAGNCLDTTTTASLQYAVQHLHVKLIVVMGW